MKNDSVDEKTLSDRLESLLETIDRASYHSDWETLFRIEPRLINTLKETEGLSSELDSKLLGILKDLQTAIHRVVESCNQEKKQALEQLVVLRKRQHAIDSYESSR